MSDTTTINTINNLLGEQTLKVFKRDGQWSVNVIINEWSEVHITRPTLRECLAELVKYLKKKA